MRRSGAGKCERDSKREVGNMGVGGGRLASQTIQDYIQGVPHPPQTHPDPFLRPDPLYSHFGIVITYLLSYSGDGNRFAGTWHSSVFLECLEWGCPCFKQV